MKIFSAPGKAILCGEYAVLEGGRAISTAVDRFVRATVGIGEASGPFVEAARRAVAKHLGRADAAAVKLTIDSSALYVGTRKIGLGSSAAVAVVTVVALLDAAGISADLQHADGRALVYRLVEAAHAEAQAEAGSGVDVATAIAGGIIGFSRAPLAIESVKLPDQLRLTFVDIGHSASTPQLVAMVRRFKSANATRYDAAITAIRDSADEFFAAVTAHDAAATVAAADRAYHAMAALGRQADAPIVTAPFDALASFAQKHAAAAKPSGAGGGDLAVLFSVGDERTTQLRAALTAAKFSILSLGAGAPGVRLEQP